MAVTAVQRAQYAYNAGFRNTAQVEALSIMVAISLCECGVGSSTGCETSCVGVEGDLTCGITQVDCVYHSNCRLAVDPQQAMNLAWQISAHGTDFTKWATYTEPSAPNYYLTCLAAARAAVAQIAPPVPPPTLPSPPPVPPPPTPPPAPAAIDLVPLVALAGVGVFDVIYARRHPGAVPKWLRHQQVAPRGRLGSTGPLLRPSREGDQTHGRAS